MSRFELRWISLLGALVLAVLVAPVYASEGPPKESGTYSDSEYWRGARVAGSGYTTDRGTEAGVLINIKGDEWRHTRNGYVKEFAKWALGVVVLLIALVFLGRGCVRIENGRSGKTVQRWTPFNRFLHWYVAVLFVVLAITGLSLLFGKQLLIPLMGKEAFASWAALAKDMHNYGGPLFSVGLLVMTLLWVKHNLPKAIDLKWFAAGGGILTKQHPSAEFMNGGEKVWFWISVIGGAVVIATGLVLDFPIFDQMRETMQNANVLHTLTALILVAVFLGHVYIATIGTEGALEGMLWGEVDVEWAKQHHDLWYKKVAGDDRTN